MPLAYFDAKLHIFSQFAIEKTQKTSFFFFFDVTFYKNMEANYEELCNFATSIAENTVNGGM